MSSVLHRGKDLVILCTSFVHVRVCCVAVTCFLCALQLGFTPLHTSAQSGHTEVVAILLQYPQVDVNTHIEVYCDVHVLYT